MTTDRQRAIRKALRATAPGIPLADAQAVMERAIGGRLRHLPPSIALWLALTSHVRHRHTDYDALLAEGYDRDAARYFVVEATDEVLRLWGCARSVADEAAEAEDEEG